MTERGRTLQQITNWLGPAKGKADRRAKAKGSSALGPGQAPQGLASSPRRGRCCLLPPRRPQPHARSDPTPSLSGRTASTPRPPPPCGDAHQPTTTRRSPGAGPGPGRDQRHLASCCRRHGLSSTAKHGTTRHKPVRHTASAHQTPARVGSSSVRTPGLPRAAYRES